jgi:hypothetical protein
MNVDAERLSTIGSRAPRVCYSWRRSLDPFSSERVLAAERQCCPITASHLAAIPITLLGGGFRFVDIVDQEQLLTI